VQPVGTLYLLKQKVKVSILLGVCPKVVVASKMDTYVRICRIVILIVKRNATKNSNQRPRLAAGLEFEKRRARLQSPVLKIELKIILN